ncbi:MAG TPA: hypothetical protein VGV89_05655 [Thermoplasmata archaeon]|nr:hypothetical protein [Thermoplasmata archaeon]
MDFDPMLYEGTGTVYLWGEDRTATAVAAFALARRVGASIAWLNIPAPSGGSGAAEGFIERLLPEVRRFNTHSPADLRPRSDAFDTIRWSLRRSDGSRGSVALLFNLLRLPASALPILRILLAGESVPALVITNADRIAASYPDELDATRRITHIVTRARIKLILSYNGPARADRFAFDHVLRIDRGPAADWRAATVVTEAPIPPASLAGSEAARLEFFESVRQLLGEPVTPTDDLPRVDTSVGSATG